ncbi:MAG: SDR family NAD(P)-dependent oxidoreductase, partial [Dongiaceae bacterium]
MKEHRQARNQRRQQMGKLSGRVAIVTGGASGIGYGIADLFCKEGAKVAIVDKNSKAAKSVAAHLARKRGAATFATACDVGEESQVKKAFAQVVKALGEVDVLVNNAGYDSTRLVVDMPTKMWDDMIRVNLRSIFLCTREVLPAMQRKRWGRIINISSQLAHRGAETMAHYCAAKAGVMGFTRSLAYEAIKHNITVNSINPGATQTPLLRSIPKSWLKKKFAEIPAGRPGRIEEIAPSAVMLASD